jgi:hypothetical protein
VGNISSITANLNSNDESQKELDTRKEKWMNEIQKKKEKKEGNKNEGREKHKKYGAR